MQLGDPDADRVSDLGRSSHRVSDDRTRWLGEPPAAVRVKVTVLGGPRGPSIRERVADIHASMRAAALIGLVVVIAAIVAFLVTGPLAGRNETSRHERAQLPGITAPRVARANGPPLACTAGATASHDLSSAVQAFDRAVWCLALWRPSH